MADDLKISGFIKSVMLQDGITKMRAKLASLEGTWVDRCKPVRYLVIRYYSFKLNRLIKKSTR